MTKKQLIHSFKGELKAFGYKPRTIGYYESIVSQFLDLTGVKSDYNREHIVTFLKALAPLNHTSTGTYIRVIRRFFKFLKIVWPLESKELNIDTGIGGEALSEDEANKMLNYAKSNGSLEDYTILRLLAATGMRAGEMGLLNKRDYASPRLIIHLEKSKGNEFRVLDLDEETVETVNRYLFVRKDNNEALILAPTSGDRIDGATVGRIFHRIAEGCKIYRKGLGAHSVRRGWATWLARQGMDIYSLQRAGGWKNIKMPARYVRLIPGEAEKKAMRLNPVIKK